MRSSRGFTLIAALWIASLVLAVTLASAGLAASVQARLARHKAEQAAAAMAVSGADYGTAMIRRARWTSDREFRSPDLDGGGWFDLKARRGPSGWVLESTGCFGPSRRTVTRRVP